jgi:N-glycosylase/DNA lyase
MLRRYFALDGISLVDLYADWSRRDPNFIKKTSDGRFAGIRVLRQDAWEALIAFVVTAPCRCALFTIRADETRTISFICSSNNNISRITLMLNRLCANFGTPLPSPLAFPYSTTTPCSDGSAPLLQAYSFPPPERLAQEDVEPKLRQLGFGYRAPYVASTASLLCNLSPSDPLGHLDSLASLPLPEAREALIQFSGVGPKVADCILLFGLGFQDIVPVDTHVFQIATRDYGFRAGGGGGKGNKAKAASATGKDAYRKVGDLFRDLWGPKAGWAHQVRFLKGPKHGFF